ncbi:MAG: steroid 3-ketoacyl-CoA thiolase, partial [Candidatus Hodarchaeota archaeon]
IVATQKVLEKSKLSIDDFDLYEVNEAFAPVPLAWLKEIKPSDWEKRLNVNGSAIALGHPVGCSGARIVATLMHEMERRKAFRSLISFCQGFGMGSALILERCE